MGSQTGVDFLRWLRIQMKLTSIPVVMYAGYRGVFHLSDCYAAGANHFLSKPAELTGAKTILRTLHLCISSSPPRFEPLTCLPEYHPDPRKPSNEQNASRRLIHERQAEQPFTYTFSSR
jgi:CheY-like chemotaxis protein